MTCGNSEPPWSTTLRQFTGIYQACHLSGDGRIYRRQPLSATTWPAATLQVKMENFNFFCSAIIPCFLCSESICYSSELPSTSSLLHSNQGLNIGPILPHLLIFWIFWYPSPKFVYQLSVYEILSLYTNLKHFRLWNQDYHIWKFWLVYMKNNITYTNFDKFVYVDFPLY